MASTSNIQSAQIKNLGLNQRNEAVLDDKASDKSVNSSRDRAGSLRAEIKTGRGKEAGLASASPQKLSTEDIHKELNDFYKTATGRNLI